MKFQVVHLLIQFMKVVLAQIDESMNKSYANNDDIDNDDGYNHEELMHAAIEDLNDDLSQANEVFKNALNELSNQDPSSIHSNSGHFQSQQSTNVSNSRKDSVYHMEVLARTAEAHYHMSYVT